jgi:hypothetical protein
MSNHESRAVRHKSSNSPPRQAGLHDAEARKNDGICLPKQRSPAGAGLRAASCVGDDYFISVTCPV